MVLSESEYEMYIDQKVKNLIQDETARIIDNRAAFADWAHAYSILKEEIEETDEELEEVKDQLNTYWKLIRDVAPDAVMVERLQVIAYIAENIIHEAKQVGAVAKKAIEQLEKPKESMNVAAYKLNKALNEYEKGTCHRPK